MNIKEKYVNFFIKNKGHLFLEPASLVPKDDSTLFTSAGIQQLVPYMVRNDLHPMGGRLTNYQKCLRLTDIDNIGDSYHHTFFEMLGNWSIDDYFKKEVIEMSYEFLTKEINLDPNRLAVSVFGGGDGLPRDDEAAQYWMNLGIPKERIAYLGYEDNWWPSVNEKGPCGTDTEMFYWRSNDPVPINFDPEDDRWVEIWNNVFIQFCRDENKNLTKLKRKYIDTGMGVERVTAILENVDDNYESSLFKSSINVAEKYSNKNYSEEKYKRDMRVIADHIRAIIMTHADDKTLLPTNKDRGYVVRRLIRRLIISSKKLEIDNFNNFIDELVDVNIDELKESYPYVIEEQKAIKAIVKNENEKFSKVLKTGTKKINAALDEILKKGYDFMDPRLIFTLYERYGVPFDLTYSILKDNNIRYDTEAVEKLLDEHKQKSRESSKEKFGDGLGGNSTLIKKLTQ